MLGKDTPLPSLELALEPNYLVGNCDNGYSCVYMNTLSWRTPTTPLPIENNPRVVFERLFGDGGTAAQRLAQARENRSILDSVTDGHGAGCRDGSGPATAPRSSDYLDVGPRDRAADPERRERGDAIDAADARAAVGIPERFDEHVKLMFDLQWLAFQADITRVFTFMLGRELNSRTYPGDRRHRGAPRAVAPQRRPGAAGASYAKINTYQAQLFAAFLEKLRVDARRRRHAARPLDDPLRRRTRATRTCTRTSTCRWRVVGGGRRRAAATCRTRPTRR